MSSRDTVISRAVEIAARELQRVWTEAAKENAPAFGRWERIQPSKLQSWAPMYACGSCGGGEHLHGGEYRKRKIVCDNCGRINIYPWEEAYEEGSSLWQQEGAEHVIRPGETIDLLSALDEGKKQSGLEEEG